MATRKQNKQWYEGLLWAEEQAKQGYLSTVPHTIHGSSGAFDKGAGDYLRHRASNPDVFGGK